jgi:hypothetical protein
MNLNDDGSLNSSSSSSSSSSSLLRPIMTDQAKERLAGIKNKNIRVGTRKTYGRNQQKIWAYLKDASNGFPASQLNGDGSLTQQGCKTWAADACWFEGFITSLTPDDLAVPGGSPLSGDEIISTKGLGSLEGFRSSIHKYLEEQQVEQTGTYKTQLKLLFAGLSRKTGRRKKKNVGCFGNSMNFVNCVLSISFRSVVHFYLNTLLFPISHLCFACSYNIIMSVCVNNIFSPPRQRR